MPGPPLGAKPGFVDIVGHNAFEFVNEPLPFRERPVQFRNRLAVAGHGDVPRRRKPEQAPGFSFNFARGNRHGNSNRTISRIIAHETRERHGTATSHGERRLPGVDPKTTKPPFPIPSQARKSCEPHGLRRA